MWRHLSDAVLPLLALWSCLSAEGQSNVKASQPTANTVKVTEQLPQLSPGYAYREAMRPVEVTRASVANWSDVEQASLGVAIKQASVACAARSPASYSAGDLVELGRLCALGQAWPSIIEATSQYLHEEGTAKPRMAEAYAMRINAELQLKDEASALKDAKEMLSAAPYISLAAEATDQALGYMHLLYTADAVSLAAKRQPMVLAALQVDASARASLGDTAIPVSELYKQGLALAELQQLQAEPAAAQDTITALDAAVPQVLANDDAIAIKGMRSRYAQLGLPLIPIPGLASLNVPVHMPEIPAHRAITALLLFPDWCVQCVRLARQMPETVFTVEDHEAYAYGLLAQTVAPQKMPTATGKSAKAQTDTYNPAYAAEYLLGTPTVTVPASLLDAFDATDVPLLIVVDSHGIVRLFDVAGETALNPGDVVDSAIALVGKRWPTAGN
jgi:hypothetical protein